MTWTWIHGTQEHPCPICGRPTPAHTSRWCATSPNQKLALCYFIGVSCWKRAKGGGWLHKLAAEAGNRPTGGSTAAPSGGGGRMQKLALTVDWPVLVKLYAAARNGQANELGVSEAALRRLDTGWDGEALTFPMRDAAEVVIGIRRRYADGRKVSVQGSREGMFLPTGWTREGAVYVCEGPTDTAAMLSLGLEAVGRPSCSGAVEMACALLSGADVVIVVDRDEPGIDGACALVARLSTRARGLRIVLPPRGAKDARAALLAGATRAEWEIA